MFIEKLRIEAELEEFPELQKILGKNLEKFITWCIGQRALYKSDIRYEVIDFIQIYLPYQGKRKQKRKLKVRC